MFASRGSAAALGRAMVLAAALTATALAVGCESVPPGKAPAGPPTTTPGGSAAAPPAATGTPAAARCPAAPYGPLSSAPGTGKTVALTFDDGPGRSTAAILAVLTRYQVPATFFNIGVHMAARPALVRDEARDGYALGDHTWDHRDLVPLPAAGQAAELDRAGAEQWSLTRTMPCVFRPPSGHYDAATLRLAQQRRMGVWLWSVDTQDWMADGSGSSYWVQRIIRLAETGGARLRHPVVLMHNQPIGNPATVTALPVIIRFFRSHGYTFVAL